MGTPDGVPSRASSSRNVSSSSARHGRGLPHLLRARELEDRVLGLLEEVVAAALVLVGGALDLRRDADQPARDALSRTMRA